MIQEELAWAYEGGELISKATIPLGMIQSQRFGNPERDKVLCPYTIETQQSKKYIECTRCERTTAQTAGCVLYKIQEGEKN